MEAGATLINDVWALRKEGAVATARALAVPICLMHMQGTPETMQDRPCYGNVVKEVKKFLLERVNVCLDSGIPRERLLVDPGFGFGKNFNHNRSLILELNKLDELGLPITVGFSHKGFVGMLLGDAERDRAGGSAGLALVAVQRGARVVRCHDVSITRDLIRSWERLQQPEEERE